MARDLSIVYNGVTLGSSSVFIPVERMSLRIGYNESEFNCQFLVTGSSFGAMSAGVSLVEANLRLPRQRLTVGMGAATFLDWNPTTASVTAYEQQPTLTLAPDQPNSGTARRYSFSVQAMRPANLSGQDGRRTEDIDLVYTNQDRRLVRIAGVWTTMPGATGRAQYDAQIDAHATTVLTALDGSASWSKVDSSESANDSNTELTYNRIYWEVVSGRRGSNVELLYDVSKRRIVVITGVYVKTGSSSAKTLYVANEDTHSAAVLAALLPAVTFAKAEDTYDVNEQDEHLTFRRVYWEVVSGRRGSQIDVNYDPSTRRRVTITGEYVLTGATAAASLYTTNEDTHSAAVLAAIGGNYELIEESRDDNEQDELLKFRRVYLEIINNQKASGVDDTDIFSDNLRISSLTTAPGDSPLLFGVAASVPPVDGKSGSSGLSFQTQDKSGGAGGGVNGGGQIAQGRVPRRLVELRVSYDAWVKKTVTDLRAKWTGGLRAHVIAQVSSKLGLAAVALTQETFEIEPTASRIYANLTLQALASTLIELSIDTTLNNNRARLYTPILGGNPHIYLAQQGPPKTTKTISTKALYRFGAYTSDNFIFGDHGAFKQLQTTPSTRQIVLGTTPSVTLESLSLVEEFLLVLGEVQTTNATGSPASPGTAKTQERPGTGAGSAEALPPPDNTSAPVGPAIKPQIASSPDAGWNQLENTVNKVKYWPTLSVD